MQISAWIEPLPQQKTWQANPLLDKPALDRKIQPRYWLNSFILDLDLTNYRLVPSELASPDASRTARALFIDPYSKQLARFHHRSRHSGIKAPGFIALSCSTKFSSVLLPLGLYRPVSGEASTFLFLLHHPVNWSRTPFQSPDCRLPKLRYVVWNFS